MTDGDDVVKEMDKARMTADERDVKKEQTIFNNWMNPFAQTDDEEICHLASGLTASVKIENDLHTAHNQGKEAMIVFFQEEIAEF